MSLVAGESLLEEARKAIDGGAWQEAHDLLSQVRSSEPLAPEDLERLADAAWWTGRLEDSIGVREQAFAEYLKRNEPRKAAHAAVALSRDYFAKLSRSMGAGWLSRAERLLENEPEGPERGFLITLKAFKAWGDGDFDEMETLAEDLLRIGMQLGDRDLQAFGLLFQGNVMLARGNVEQGLGLLDEATVAAVSGELGALATGLIYCAAITSTTSLRDYRRAGEWTEAARRWCERQAISGFPGICRVHRAEIMHLRGSWAEAEQDLRRALTELMSFNLDHAALAFYQLGEIRLRMGDLRSAEDAFRQAEEMGVDPQPGLAHLRLAEGDIDAAARGIRRALAGEVGGPLSRFPLLHAQVEIAVLSGDLETAKAAATELEEIASIYGTAALRAAASACRGVLQIALGDPETAGDTLRKALRLWKEADVPYEAARTRVLLAEAYEAAGDPETARLELKDAASAFQRLGAVLDLRKTRELMGEDSAEDRRQSRVAKAFMFTDIVKSTDLVEVLGDEAWSHLLEWHDRTLRGLFLANGGEEVKQIGDGFFVAFDRPDDALACAVAIQRALLDHRRAHGFAPRVRIGLHSGDAARKGSDYEGKQVHQAARIGALAAPDEVLVSKASYLESEGRFKVFETRVVTLKGIAEPVEIVAIDWR